MTGWSTGTVSCCASLVCINTRIIVHLTHTSLHPRASLNGRACSSLHEPCSHWKAKFECEISVHTGDATVLTSREIEPFSASCSCEGTLQDRTRETAGQSGSVSLANPKTSGRSTRRQLAFGIRCHGVRPVAGRFPFARICRMTPFPLPIVRSTSGKMRVPLTPCCES